VLLACLPGLAHLGPRSAAEWVAVGAGIAGIVAGGLVVLSGFRDLGPSLTPMPRPRDDAGLVEGGIYAWIRHPIYAGLILGALGCSAVARSLLAVTVTLLLAIFLDLKSRREEGWLADRYPGYDAYRRRTRRFLPGIY
jgi:protein-S-isoprenylcysteine O-methyltransferase Ste14